MSRNKQKSFNKVFITFPQQLPRSSQEWNRTIKEFVRELKRKLRNEWLKDFLNFVRFFVVHPLKFISQKTNLAVEVIVLIAIFCAVFLISFSLYQKNKNTPQGVAKLFIKNIEKQSIEGATIFFVDEIKGEMKTHFSELFKNSQSIDYFKTDYIVIQDTGNEAIVKLVTDYKRKDTQGNIYRYLVSSGFEEFYDAKTGANQRFKISSGRLIEEFLGFSPSASTYGMFTEVKLVKEKGRWLIRSVR